MTNAPPKPGRIEVGDALIQLDDFMFIEAVDFADDPNDLPLSYGKKIVTRICL